MYQEGPMKQCHACGSDDCVVIGAEYGPEGPREFWNRCNDCGYIGKTYGEGVSQEQVDAYSKWFDSPGEDEWDDLIIAAHPAHAPGGDQGDRK